MIRSIKVGRATLVVSFTDDYDDSEEVGFGGYFEVNRKRYAELHGEYGFEQYMNEEIPEWDEEEHDTDEDITVSTGDDFIVFANSIGIEGGTWHIEYGGAPYWLFHDLDHAEYDCQGGRVVGIDMEGRAEGRALLGGAKSAYKHAVPLGEIFRELAKSAPAFPERFGGAESTAIDDFADFLKTELTNSGN